MSRPYPSVAGIDVLVPPIALGIGMLTGLVVYRHATRHQVQSPLLWSGFVGGSFFCAPIILQPYLIPVYYSLFNPSGPGFLVKPVHALATIIGGGSLAGLGVALIYLANLAHSNRQDAISA